MARKKILDEDAENVSQHLVCSPANHNLHDTNVKQGMQTQSQMKLKLSNSNGKINQPMHKGNKYNNNHNTSPTKTTAEESFSAVSTQLFSTGLTIREMPGDGNCLFRALADQLEGHPRNHLEHRRAVVDFMRKHRPDFEPFVEDDEPFEKYVQSLAQPGTFAGNDAIVAFARLHNVTVVIHQLNSPAWLIHPSEEQSSSGREAHIAYHNGDHYNSVRKLGDDSDAPANIKLSIQESHSGCSNKGIKTNNATGRNSPPRSGSSVNSKIAPTSTSTLLGSGYQSSQDMAFDSMLGYGRRDEDFWVKDSSDIERLVAEVMEQTDYPDPIFVRDTLLEFNFDITGTVDFILSMNFYINETEQEQRLKLSADEKNQNEASLSLQEDKSAVKDKELESLPDTVEAMSTSVTNNTENPDLSVSGSETLVTTILTTTEPVSINQGISIDLRKEHSPPPSQKENNGGNSRGYKVKLSTRQKKDLKKRERKRESDLRKLRDSENVDPSKLSTSSTPTTTIVVSSNLGSLNI